MVTDVNDENNNCLWICFAAGAENCATRLLDLEEALSESDKRKRDLPLSHSRGRLRPVDFYINENDKKKVGLQDTNEMTGDLNIENSQE